MAHFGTPATPVGAPLLFTVPQELGDYSRASRTGQSPARGDSTSLSRRSYTPGSVHTDNTPPRPPPRERLDQKLLADGADSHAAPGTAGTAAAAATSTPPAALPAVMPLEPGPQASSCWVTVYGFSPGDLPLILREFQKCGDILQWGTFGSAPQSNFVHIQYQNPYSAQRALLRTNEQISSTLIVGVKPLDPMHKQLIEAAEHSSDVFQPRMRAPAVPLRPYKVEPSPAAALPQPALTLTQKIAQFVLGI